MSIQLHERHEVTHMAEVDLRIFLLDWRKKHDLTLVEELRLLMDSCQSISKYLLRWERHEDMSKKADEA